LTRAVPGARPPGAAPARGNPHPSSSFTAPATTTAPAGAASKSALLPICRDRPVRPLRHPSVVRDGHRPGTEIAWSQRERSFYTRCHRARNAPIPFPCAVSS